MSMAEPGEEDHGIRQGPRGHHPTRWHCRSKSFTQLSFQKFITESSTVVQPRDPGSGRQEVLSKPRPPDDFQDSQCWRAKILSKHRKELGVVVHTSNLCS